MERFLDIVKIDFDENIERYFRDVEVESIKKSKSHNTLNFYLVSYNIIPYNYLKEVRSIMAKNLLDLNSDDTNSENYANPINSNIKYKLSDNYTCKAIYDEIRRDLFDELKEIKVLYAAFFRHDKIKFLDDNTMQISLIKAKEFKDIQTELVKSIKNIFENRYNRNINIV